MDPRFVVHEHHASRLHYDFRLELDGVLRSWAVPKGPSMNPSERRLALQVEDHLLEYIDFEGIIPQGQYGAGAVVIWDSGTYDLIEKRAEKITVFLQGEKLKGGFTLTLLKGRGKGNEWLLIKKRDAHAHPVWTLNPTLTPEKRASLKERIPPCQTS
ncbi:MAG: 3'-phosphoesterase [Proteobacteria bacterium]|nr:3'-phosphoesterase [Pseudomonadota bacterium]NIS71724.1 3'-phosphoesterase [Pseudomonadota bacterium]